MYAQGAPTVQNNFSATNAGQYAGASSRVPTGTPRPPNTVQGPSFQNAPKRPVKKPAKKPSKRQSALAKWLAGDSTYQDQKAMLAKQLGDFQAQNSQQRGYVNTDFTTALQKMQGKRTQDLENLEADYAARGMLTSGLYLDSQGDYNTDYNQNLADLNTDKQRSLADILLNMQNYRTQNTSALNNARQDAIRRRAQQLGIT